MTTFTRNALAFAIVIGTALPAFAGQSANRSTSGVSNRSQPVPASAAVPESPTAAKCREHCGSLTASGPHQTHRNVADSAAQSANCLRKMAN